MYSGSVCPPAEGDQVQSHVVVVAYTSAVINECSRTHKDMAMRAEASRHASSSAPSLGTIGVLRCLPVLRCLLTADPLHR